MFAQLSPLLCPSDIREAPDQNAAIGKEGWLGTMFAFTTHSGDGLEEDSLFRPKSQPRS
jgi:hypothetical protein